MVFERASEGRLTRHIARETNSLGIKARLDGQHAAFSLFGGRFKIEVLPYDLATALVHHPGCRANLFVRKARYLLLQKIDQSSFTLQRAQQHQPRSMNALRRQRGRLGLPSLNSAEPSRDLGREFAAENQAKRQAKARKKGNTILFHPGKIQRIGAAATRFGGRGISRQDEQAAFGVRDQRCADYGFNSFKEPTDLCCAHGVFV